MKHDRMIASLKNFGEVLPKLIADVSKDDARWKPPTQNWSILEIVCHLCDEEVEDFRKRLQMTFADPDDPWPSINPESWAVERKYNEQDLQERTQNFIAEREKSLLWLESLDAPDWNIAYQHPHFGPMKAGDVLGAWTVHDQLHVRQIAKRKYEMIRRDAAGFDVGYAGDWRES